MNARNDLRGWFAEAQDHLRSAEDALPRKDYKVVVHYGQLALELSAKTIISYFYEPEWSHDPSKDLLNIIRMPGKKLEQRLSKATVREMCRLASDAKQYAKWHVWSTYGQREPGKPYLSPDQLCTADVVKDLMPRTRHAVALAERFVAAFS